MANVGLSAQEMQQMDQQSGWNQQVMGKPGNGSSPTGGGASQSQDGGDTSGGDWRDLIPSITGSIGSVIGEAAGTPLDAVSGPGGTMAGGAVGGGIGGAIGAGIEDATKGKFDLGDILSQAGQQGAYGAIPGLSEGKLAAKLGTGLIGKTVGHAIAGGAGSAGAQAISDVGQGKMPGSDVLGAGVAGAGFNALGPGAGKALSFAKNLPAVAAFGPSVANQLPKIVNKTGKIQGKTGEAMANDLFNRTGKTSSLEDNMQNILSNGNGVSRGKISSAIDEAIGDQPGISGGLSSGQQGFKDNVMNTLDNLLLQHQDTPGAVREIAGNPLTSQATMEALQNNGAIIPTSVVHDLMNRVGTEIQPSSWLKPHGPLDKTMIAARGKLRDLVTGSIPNPEDARSYNDIQAMREAAREISGALKGGKGQGGFMGAAQSLAGDNPLASVGTGVLTSLLSGNPLLGLGAGAAERIITSPKNAVHASQGSIKGANTAGKIIRALGQRGASAVGGAIGGNSQ